MVEAPEVPELEVVRAQEELRLHFVLDHFIADVIAMLGGPPLEVFVELLQESIELVGLHAIFLAGVTNEGLVLTHHQVEGLAMDSALGLPVGGSIHLGLVSLDLLAEVDHELLVSLLKDGQLVLGTYIFAKFGRLQVGHLHRI